MNEGAGNPLMVDGDDEDDDDEGEVEGAEMVDGDEQIGEDEIDMFSAADECVFHLHNRICALSLQCISGSLATSAM